MRLIDRHEGHLFVLPPPNVVLLAPRPKRSAAPLAPAPAPARSLTVHDRSGAATRYVQTRTGWRRSS